MTRVAIVTGSAQGIGRAIALRLAHDGYDVAINDISANQPLAEAVAQEIRDMGQKSTVAIADVSRLSEVTHMIEHVVQELGPLTTMVANAGIAQVKPLLDLTEDDFERMFRVNVFGVQNCYQAAAKQIIKQGTATPESPAKLIGVCPSLFLHLAWTPSICGRYNANFLFSFLFLVFFHCRIQTFCPPLALQRIQMGRARSDASICHGNGRIQYHGECVCPRDCGYCYVS